MNKDPLAFILHASKWFRPLRFSSIRYTDPDRKKGLSELPNTLAVPISIGEIGPNTKDRVFDHHLFRCANRRSLPGWAFNVIYNLKLSDALKKACDFLLARRSSAK